jgi:hypothetical protein
MNNQQIETLKSLGGRDWTSGDGSKRRIYFNNLAELAGLSVTAYESGNIRSATFDGEAISNSEARKIESALRWAKLYYDFADDQFHGEGTNGYFKTIVSAIRAQIS